MLEDKVLVHRDSPAVKSLRGFIDINVPPAPASAEITAFYPDYTTSMIAGVSVGDALTLGGNSLQLISDSVVGVAGEVAAGMPVVMAVPCIGSGGAPVFFSRHVLGGHLL